MRHVLFVAYHFPPIGGAGVQRTLKFVRYLPSLGYLPRVVTGPGRSDWMPSDAAMTREVPGDVEVVRMLGEEPPEGGRWATRAERWLGRTSAFEAWWTQGAGRRARDAGEGMDLIYVSMPPFESAEIGMSVAEALRRPWVADLRDSWAIDELAVYPSRLHRRRDAARMRAILGTAAAIVMNTREAASRLVRRFPELAAVPVVTITNGFDAEDFARPSPRRDDPAFRIVHTGLFLSELGARHRRTRLQRRVLGGAHPDLDIMTRSPAYLLDALDRLVDGAPELRGVVELHLAGTLSGHDRELIANCGAEVRDHGYLTHPESVDLIRSADLLFLPMHTPPPRVRSASMPGKTFEYLAAGRPILAAVPDGDARDILVRSGGALLARPSDVAQMAGLIAEEIERWRAGRPTPPPDPAVVAEFERRRLTQRLAAVFDRALGLPAAH